jgi:hypothetical protein
VHPAMAGRDPGRGYQSVAGCRRVHILIHFVWKKEMERRWCNHFFNLVILCYTQYILYLYIYMNIVIWFNSQYCWVAKHLQTSMITESVSVQHPELDEAGPLDLHSTVFDFFYVLSPQKMKSGPWSMTGTTTGWIWFESWPLSVCGDESRLISSRWLRFGSVWLHPSFFFRDSLVREDQKYIWWCVFTTNYGAYIAWYFNHSMSIIVYISLQTMASIGKFPSLVTFQTFQVGVEWPVLLGLTIPRRPHLGSITDIWHIWHWQQLVVIAVCHVDIDE